MAQDYCLHAAFFLNKEPSRLGHHTLYISATADTDVLSSDEPPQITSGRRATNPLFIKSLNDTIIVDEYMVWPLPEALYGGEPADPSISMNNPKVPTHVFQWIDFEPNVANRIDSTHYQHSTRIEKLDFTIFPISEEVQSL